MKPFKDPIAPSYKKSSKTFVSPSKEQATTGRFMSAGDSYGVGFKTPEGKFVANDMKSGPIPQESKAFSCEDVI